MKQVFHNKFLLVTVATVFVFVALIGIVRATVAFYPDQALRWSTVIEDYLRKTTLPLKVARLSQMEPDKEILMPVYGLEISSVTDTWHAPRGADRVHEGQDMFAPIGTPLFSAADGYITQVTDATIGGTSVYITGRGGRVYYYTHLDRYPDGIKVGQMVTTDTVIGFLGNTGNAATTPPHLHFGVYEPDGEAINPLLLLQDRQWTRQP